jgi:hypothetical protein
MFHDPQFRALCYGLDLVFRACSSRSNPVRDDAETSDLFGQIPACRDHLAELINQRESVQPITGEERGSDPRADPTGADRILDAVFRVQVQRLLAERTLRQFRIVVHEEAA